MVSTKANKNLSKISPISIKYNSLYKVSTVTFGTALVNYYFTYFQLGRASCQLRQKSIGNRRYCFSGYTGSLNVSWNEKFIFNHTFFKTHCAWIQDEILHWETTVFCWSTALFGPPTKIKNYMQIPSFKSGNIKTLDDYLKERHSIYYDRGT